MLCGLETSLKKPRMESFPQLHHTDGVAERKTVRGFLSLDMVKMISLDYRI